MRAQIAAAASLLVGLGAMAAILLAGPGLVAPLLGTGSAALQETLFVLLLFGAMLIVALGAGLVLRRNVVVLGGEPVRYGVLGVGLGLAGIGLAAGYATIAGTLHGGAGTAGPALLGGALLVLFQATTEEVYFRGWLQPVLAQAWGIVPAILVTALGFAGLHFLGGGAKAPLAFVNLLLGGLLFGTLAAQGGGPAGAIGAHFAWNSAEQLVLGLDPNPGIGSFGALLDLDLGGAPLWGGSEDGLNASLAMAVALLALLVPLAMLARTAKVRS